MLHENNKGTDQLAHPFKMVSVFVICCQKSITAKLTIHKTSINYFVSVAGWFESYLASEDRDARDKAQLSITVVLTLNPNPRPPRHRFCPCTPNLRYHPCTFAIAMTLVRPESFY